MTYKEKISFSIWDTSVFIRADEEISHPTLQAVFEVMRARGFEIGSDPRIDRDYPILSNDHFAGSKGDLLFEAKRYRIGAEIKFYQELNTEHRSGGRFDFDKFQMMPYLLKKQFLLETRYIKEKLLEEGYEDQSEPTLKAAHDKVMYELNRSDRHWSSDNLPDYNALDKDGRRLNNGEIKYFRDRKGVLMRGTVYHNINNMWWVIVNKDCFRNLGSFELFDLDAKPENKIRKLVSKSGFHNPKSRFIPTEEQLKGWRKKAKQAGKEGRIEFANEILAYFYEIGWMSRKFKFYMKENKRLGLVETEGNPYFIGMRLGERKYDPPKNIHLYPRPGRMSSTESGWVENLRDYVTYGKPTVTRWFCKDSVGYMWPEVRERLLLIGAYA